MSTLAPLSSCTGCSACAAVCPKQCIQMLPNEEGFLHPIVERSACIECGLCTKSCPVLQPSPISHADTQAYAAICNDEPTRMASTSGGVFTALSKWIFDRNGIVFGAAYGKDFSVFHRAVSSMEELPALRTAKYAQSELGDTFSQVKTLLSEGQYVLFSGTPCQIAGLRSFLKKDYPKLILVDVICHGVPSPQVWQHYIRYRKEQDAPGSSVASINLRSKETGWPGYSIRFDYENGAFYSAKNSIDPFLQGFVGDLYLRPSCYDCHFKGISRNSDFTLADYWGIDAQLPEFNDGKGTSLVLVHSEKANIIWSEISSGIRYQEVDSEKSVAHNQSAVCSSHKPAKQPDFWERYENEDFNALISELLLPPPPPSLLKRGLRKLKRVIQRK